MNEYNCPECGMALALAQQFPDKVTEGDTITLKTAYHCTYCAKDFMEEIIYTRTRRALVYAN